MEAGVILVFMLVQVGVGTLFLVWLWVVRIRDMRRHSLEKRENSLFIAAVCLTAAVAVDAYFMFASGITHPKALVFFSFGLACLAVLFSLFGRGKGRILGMMAGCGLVISWLPFILP